jgi:hypothetical protein
VFEVEKKHDYISKRFIEGLFLSYLWSVDRADSSGINSSTIPLLPKDEQLARDRGAVSPYAPLYIACIRQVCLIHLTHSSTQDKATLLLVSYAHITLS